MKILITLSRLSGLCTRATAGTLILIGLVATPRVVHAAQTWSWSVSTNFGNGSGTLTTASLLTNVPMDILTITGTFNGVTIMGLSGFNVPDNQVQWDGSGVSPLYVSLSGFSFEMAGGAAANLYNINVPGPAANIDNTSFGTGSVISSSLSPAVAAPEPATIALLTIGGGAMLQRRRQQTTSRK